MSERPSIAELRQVTQPPSVRNRNSSEHWTADLYQRRWSPYLTRVLIRSPLSANGVTALMILAGASGAVALLIDGIAGAVLAVLLIQLQMFLDCSDGEVARWRQTFSPAGIFLDKLGHYTAEALIPITLGVRADGGLGDVGGWTTLGAMLSVLVVLNKAVNDAVHVSRAAVGLPRLEDRAEVTVPRRSSVRRLRSLARFVPFHRAFHSVELSLLALVAAVVDLAAGDLAGTRFLVALLLPLAVVTLFGHVAAVLTSGRLR